MNDHRNSEICQQYKALADSEQQISFGGRVAKGKFIEEALNSAVEIIEKQPAI